ncbi:MAG: SCO family protein [Pseudomonadota bacterium]
MHKSAEEAERHRSQVQAGIETPADTPGFPDIKGGDFRLVDQTGKTRTSRDPDGQFQLVFFGYASCKAICSVALPRMVEAVDQLETAGARVTPVLITVDPERDTVASLKSAVADIHPRLVGLTGDKVALQGAYDAFQVTRNVVFEHPEYGAVYAHGSYIYLLGPDGAFLTLLPPVLGTERIAQIVRKYIDGAAATD